MRSAGLAPVAGLAHLPTCSKQGFDDQEWGWRVMFRWSRSPRHAGRRRLPLRAARRHGQPAVEWWITPAIRCRDQSRSTLPSHRNSPSATRPSILVRSLKLFERRCYKMPTIETDEAVFATEAVIDHTIADVDRYLRKPSGTSDQGRSED